MTLGQQTLKADPANTLVHKATAVSASMLGGMLLDEKKNTQAIEVYRVSKRSYDVLKLRQPRDLGRRIEGVGVTVNLALAMTREGIYRDAVPIVSGAIDEASKVLKIQADVRNGKLFLFNGLRVRHRCYVNLKETELASRDQQRVDELKRQLGFR